MIWVVVTVVFVGASIVGFRLVTGSRPNVAAPNGDDARSVLPDGVDARALVRGLEQDGMSTGHSSHRCRLELVVEACDAGVDRSVPTLVDLPTTALPWFAPGNIIDVLVDPNDPARVLPAINRTRARATGIDSLPAVNCHHLDQVYLNDAEREISGGIAGEAVVGCIEITTSEHSTRDATTIGLWVLRTDSSSTEASAPEGYPVTVSERLLVVQLLEIPLGATVPITIDPADAKRVVIDYRGARFRLLDGHAPDRSSMVAALDAAGLDPSMSMASVTSLTMTGGRHGVRLGCRLTLDPVGSPSEVGGLAELSVTIPDLLLLIPGSTVVAAHDESGATTIDLCATAELRAQAAGRSSDWGRDLP